MKEMQRLREELPLRRTQSPTSMESRSGSQIRTGSLDSIGKRVELIQRYEQAVITLHDFTGIPPTIKRLNGEVQRIGDLAVAGGTFSDIWMGLWLGHKKVPPFSAFKWLVQIANNNRWHLRL